MFEGVVGNAVPHKHVQMFQRPQPPPRTPPHSYRLWPGYEVWFYLVGFSFPLNRVQKDPINKSLKKERTIFCILHNPARADKSEGGFWGAAGASETSARVYGEQHAYNSLQTRQKISILLLSMLFF